MGRTALYDRVMTDPTSQPGSGSPDVRRVLVWRAEPDESHVQASVEGAAQFLGVSSSAVVQAIDSGDLLAGWFVDWHGGHAA